MGATPNIGGENYGSTHSPSPFAFLSQGNMLSSSTPPVIASEQDVMSEEDYVIAEEPEDGDNVLNSRIRLPDGTTLNRRL
jgi:hypothetical protein